jgi:hypothetical protein
MGDMIGMESSFAFFAIGLNPFAYNGPKIKSKVFVKSCKKMKKC